MLHRENRIKEYNSSLAADLLKEVMKFYGITQENLAHRIGVRQKNISDILNRKRYLNEILAYRIEKVMSPLFLKKYDWVNTNKEALKL